MNQLLEKSKKLRAAQIAYMNNRGNEEYGKMVGMAAAELDLEIAISERNAGGIDITSYNKAIDDVITDVQEGIDKLDSEYGNPSMLARVFGDIDYEKVNTVRTVVEHVKSEIRKLKK